MEPQGRILVVGLARSGLAAANFLLRRGARVAITDVRGERELADQVKQLAGPAQLCLGGHRQEDFLEAELIVLSPGVPATLPQLQAARRSGIPIWSEVELAFRHLKGTVVGVTGSNGKTTTVSLIGAMLRDAGRECVVAGNIGAPLIARVEESNVRGASPVYVVELSSFQLETIERFRCDVALLLNVTPDHLDRYASFDDYLAAKARIFLNQRSRDFRVVNDDDPEARKLARDPGTLRFSRRRELAQGVFLSRGRIRIARDGGVRDLMAAAEVGLRGAHNLENVLAAAAAGTLLGLGAGEMAGTFRQFAGVEHRLEYVGEVGGVAYFNDSKATNVASALRALEAFHEPLLVIMGGLDKGGDFAALAGPLRERARLVVLIGAAAGAIERALSGQVPVRRAADLAEAVSLAGSRARPGDVVLLSPACASFDMFENFEHRGRVFRESVAALATGAGPAGGERNRQ